MREADHPIDPLFLERWSPRAFDGSEVPDADLLTHVRGGALGALGVQLAALALPLRQARRRGLGALPRRCSSRGTRAGRTAPRCWSTSSPTACRSPTGRPASRRPRTPTASMPAPPGSAWRCRRRAWAITPTACPASSSSAPAPSSAVPERYRLERRLRDRPDRRSRPCSTRSCARARLRADRKPVSATSSIAGDFPGLRPERLCRGRFW